MDMKHKPSGIERGLEFVAEHTFQLKERMWMENLAENLPVIRNGRDIREIPKCNGSAIVVGAGASIKRYGQLETIEGSGFGGTVIATDKMLKPCITAGIAPDLVMTADGDSVIATFYEGVGKLTEEVFRSPDQVSKKTKAILNALTVHPETVARVPYEIFWYMSPVDDPLAKRSVTRAIHFMTKKTILSSFGNVGGQAFNLACFLGADPVILVGLDCGYPPETPLKETSYYNTYAELAKRQGKKVEEYFTTVQNPDTGKEVMLDMNWGVYRKIALDHFQRAKCKIVNCSPISSLFGQNIEFVDLDEALKRWPS